MTGSSTKDPVCGMHVPADEGLPLAFEGVELRFCSEACRQEFLRHPRAYMDIPSSPASPPPRSSDR
jgi:YHS domain-containing protein